MGEVYRALDTKPKHEVALTGKSRPNGAVPDHICHINEVLTSTYTRHLALKGLTADEPWHSGLSVTGTLIC